MTFSSRGERNQTEGRHVAYQNSDLHHWESKIHAFVEICDLPAEPPRTSSGSLNSLTVAIKDIIDVAGFPTRNGSEIFQNVASAVCDAPVVAALRHAGAAIVGKTTTTEFAFTDPTDCRNPYDLTRSPGGSSSGSGAAVAAGLVDFALGTQTAGSLCRPAAYCGVVGFKPSYGWVSLEGVTPLAPSFDTIGIIARSVHVAERGFRAILSEAVGETAMRQDHCVAASMLWNAQDQIASETMVAFHEAQAALNDICNGMNSVSPVIDCAGIVRDHRTVMNFEAAQAHGHLLATGEQSLLKPKLKAGLQAGVALSEADVSSAKQRLSTARQAFWEHMAGIDVILTLPVPDGAPLMDGTTGFQDWLTPWTVFGGPLITLPWGFDGLGRPRAVMLASRPGTDVVLLNVARMLEKYAPDLPPPTLPSG